MWGIFNLPDIQQYCLQPHLLIAGEKNALKVQPPQLNTTAPAPAGVSVVLPACSPREMDRESQRELCAREGEARKEMHGQTGLKWQQSALMETDGRMRR